MLAKLSVLVTRPEGQGQALADKLQAGGLDVLLFPTLAIQPKALTPTEQQSVECLYRYSHVICVSANAAKMGVELLADYWPQWPVEQQWIAVGPATYAAMQGWGLGEVLLPVGASHSEGVLALDDLENLDDKKVLILRGVSGRELLADTLRQRGAGVDYLELYERKVPEITRLGLPNKLPEWLYSDAKKVIVVTSGDGLKNLITMAVGQERELFATSLVVVSQRLADFAKQQGFASVRVANGASDDAIALCINNNRT
ncbi:hypothetical protein A9Q81_12340 [Gammaproteobacteria bacterium 42_54_T18]|nr:hypothetical protein A9Q81_12340 [Gammaproteobacteria bacterium 42_54_T18]